MLTKEQKIARKSGLGGSDAAAACGLSKWKTPHELFLEKVSDTLQEDEETFAQLRGNLFEPVVAQMYKRKTGVDLHEPRETVKHHKHSFLFANIDYCLAQQPKYLVECKTVNERSFYKNIMWGDEGTSSIPYEYLFQCAHYAMIYDAEAVDIPVLIGLDDFKIYTYKRNAELEAELLAREIKFWEEHVLKGVPPDPITYDDALSQFPLSNGLQLKATPQLEHACIKYSNLKREIKEKQKEADVLKNIITREMSVNEYLVSSDGSQLASWKTQTRKALNQKTLKENYLDVYEACLHELSTRVFRQKDIKS